MNKNILISVIIPLYNGEKFIEEAILSVLHQTYQNFEIIVMDDCSTDNSYNIIKSFDDTRIKYVKNEQNLGLAKNLAKGINLAKGEYICLLGQDDMFTCSKFESQLTYILDKDLDVCYSSNYTYFSKNKIIKNNLDLFAKKVEEKDETLMKDIYIPDYAVTLPMSQSAIFKTSVLKDLNYLRNTVRLDDWPILVKTFENYNVGFLNKPTFYWRQHDNNMHSNIWLNLIISLEAVVIVVPEDKRLYSIANNLNFFGDQCNMDRMMKFKVYCASFIMNPTKEKFLKIKNLVRKSIKIKLKNLFRGKKGER